MSEVFFCNYEEAQRILGNKETDVKKQMESLSALGPKIVVVTDGYKGAYARDVDGTCWFMPIYPHEPKERTGAGDAFASTVTSCLALGKTLEDIDYIIDTTAVHLNLSFEERQEILELVDLKKRLFKISTMLKKEIDILDERVNRLVTPEQRRIMELKALQQILGD